MPRIRANDYDDKKTGILDAAADLFATSGYTGSKMQDVAAACNVSKSMLYHYFPKKEDVLFEILTQHLESLIEALEKVDGSGTPHSEYDFFHDFIETYLESSKLSRAKHLVALNDRRFLTPDQQKQIVDLERQVLDLFVAVLRRVRPGEEADYYRTYALLLIGMMNWAELWYRRSGRISPPMFYDLISQLFLHGYSADPKAKTPKAPA